jgi:hypothetical protein
VFPHQGENFLLVGTELNHVSHLLIGLLYSKKGVCATSCTSY